MLKFKMIEKCVENKDNDIIKDAYLHCSILRQSNIEFKKYDFLHAQKGNGQSFENTISFCGVLFKSVTVKQNKVVE